MKIILMWNRILKLANKRTLSVVQSDYGFFKCFEKFWTVSVVENLRVSVEQSKHAFYKFALNTKQLFDLQKMRIANLLSFSEFLKKRIDSPDFAIDDVIVLCSKSIRKDLKGLA